MVKYEKFDEPMEESASGHEELQPSPKPEERDEKALERASNFFSTEADDSVGVEDQSEWPTIEQPLLLWRWRIRRCVESFPCRLIIILLILVDLSIIISGIAAPPKSAITASLLASLDMSLSVLFVMEVSLRFFALGFKEFVGKWYHLLDGIIVYATAMIAFLDLMLETTFPIKSLRLIAILRLLRVVRLVRLCTEKKNLENGVRKLVSQNKRRFQQDGFDLDLTYVTERMIAMSYPSTGSMAMYRNPAAEVARFLDLKHKDCYKVYNLCRERSYDPSLFHNRVERYMIDDHNVPTVKEMVQFSESVRQWLEQNPTHVAVVHCKGGKGRTGTLVCVWLVEAGIFSSATDSLGYFGQRRTDLRFGRAFQGVETPSQSRYVNYYEQVKVQGHLPEETPLLFRGLKMTGLMGVGRGDGSDFSVEVQPARDKPPIFSAHFGKLTNCQQVDYDSERDELSVTLFNCPIIKADTKMLFYCDSSNVPKGYENSAFYLWFHTGFLENNRLSLCRDELDNPHKNKTWNVFGGRFGLELFFSPPEF